MAQRFYYVYIMASKARVLYTGITNHVVKRAWEHRQGVAGGFTRRYKVHRLVYFERYPDVRRAIEREKHIKTWSRAKKVKLIESVNPSWEDLAEVWLASARAEQAEAAGKRAALKNPAFPA